MNQEGFVIRRIFLLWVAFLLAAATGCAPVQTKSTGGQAETTSAGEGEKEILEVVSQEEYLRGMLMGFADTFATKYAEATTILMEQEPGPKRTIAARFRFLTIVSAFNIAPARHPKTGIADMVILVTLNRIVWEDYWQPEVFGDSGQVVTKTLRQSEKDAWAMAAKVAAPEQIKELRALIHKWRQKNPDTHFVNFVRLDNILELSDLDSLLQKETQPGGLFAPITEATEAVDEIRFSTERAMYLLSRMQVTLGLQIEWVYLNLATQQEVRQLLSDITGLRETAERLPIHISEERQKLMQDLESQEKTIRNVVGDIREMLKQGEDLISLVNETTKMVDTTSAQINSMLARPSTGRPFDIMDYYNTVLTASDTVKQVNLLLGSMEKLMASPNWGQQMPVLLRITDGVASESKGVITHAVIMAAALILFFCLTFFPALLGYRYSSKRLVG